jgi:peptidoglycan/xylan/chitin deacetylase (PgdA/CDA1 family)
MINLKIRVKKFFMYSIEYILFKLKIIYLFEKFVKLKPGIIILYYHRLSSSNEKKIHPDSIKVDIFKEQMRYLSKNYTFITLNQAVELLEKNIELDKNYMVLTFDDGYKSLLDYWDDEIKSMNLKPTVYIIAEHTNNKTPVWTDKVDYFVYNSVNKIDISIGKRNFILDAVNEKLKSAEILKNEIKKLDSNDIEKNVDKLEKYVGFESSEIEFNLLNWSQVIKLKEMNFDIGSHTLRHYNLALMSKSIRKKEINESFELIYKNAGVEKQNFAYPFGYEEHYNKDTVECVKKIYNSGVTVIQGINYNNQNIFELKRISGGNKGIHVLISRIIKEKIKGHFLKEN